MDSEVLLESTYESFVYQNKRIGARVICCIPSALASSSFHKANGPSRSTQLSGHSKVYVDSFYSIICNSGKKLTLKLARGISYGTRRCLSARFPVEPNSCLH